MDLCGNLRRLGGAPHTKFTIDGKFAAEFARVP